MLSSLVFSSQSGNSKRELNASDLYIMDCKVDQRITQYLSARLKLSGRKSAILVNALEKYP